MKSTKQMPQNLGVVIPQFPGQTHIFFWREIIELEKMGVNVTLFSTTPPPAGLISHRWSEEAMARTVYLVDRDVSNALCGLFALPLRDVWNDLRREPSAFLTDILVSLPAARRLRRICAERNITHIHAHSARRAATVSALSFLSGGPSYSVSLHGPLSDYGAGQRFKWRHAKFGTVITEKLRSEMKDEIGLDLPDQLYLQPMGVDTEDFKPTSPYLPPKPSAPLQLFSCARLNVVKGHQDLIQAVHSLRQGGLDVSLRIAGEDDAGGTGFRAELEAQIRTLNLEDHVTLLGAISSDDVRSELLSAHIFVLASWHEPLGVAYMEAMSCGIPTIGTNAGGAPELIRDGTNGVLVEPKAPEALASAIDSLASDPERLKALSTAGRTRIVQGYSSRRGAETLVKGMMA